MASRIQRNPSDAEMNSVVSAAFPSWKGYDTVLMSGGLFNTAFLLQQKGAADDEKKYVLRFGPVNRDLILPYEHYLMAAEAWAYEKMASVGIPTSTVVFLDTSKKLLDRDVMIVEYLRSVNLASAELEGKTRETAYETAGRYCRMMNKITTKKFGRVSQMLRGQSFTLWSDFINSEFEEWADSIRKKTTGYFTEDELGRILSVPQKYKSELDEITVPMFNHCDMWELNVLMREKKNSEIVALIDPDRCCMGDPDFELASGWMVNDAFVRGYGRCFATDSATKARIDVYKLLFLLLDGYFQRVQYDDPTPSLQDKNGAMVHLDRLI